MQNIKIKNFLAPTFLQEARQNEIKVSVITGLLFDALVEEEKLLRQFEVFERMEEAIKQFKIIIPKAYPREANFPTIKYMLDKLNVIEANSYEELKEYFSDVFDRIFFSEGEDKVFDPIDLDYRDNEKFEELIDQGLSISFEWLEQFIRCMIEKNAIEDMILHNLTPEWLWPKCFRLLLELYKLTEESLKK